MKYGKTTLIIILINIIISGLVFTTTPQTQRLLFDIFGFSSEHLNVYRIITYGFLHFDLDHLLNNMIFFLIYGVFLERRIGELNILKIYFFSLILGIIIYGLLANTPKICIGASVAVCGIVGSYCCMRNKSFILTLFAVLIMSVDFYCVLKNIQDSVAHLAHVLGFIIGYLYYSFELKSKENDVI